VVRVTWGIELVVMAAEEGRVGLQKCKSVDFTVCSRGLARSSGLPAI
jgi:hypothetical protein